MTHLENSRNSYHLYQTPSDLRDFNQWESIVKAASLAVTIIAEIARDYEAASESERSEMFDMGRASKDSTGGYLEIFDVELNDQAFHRSIGTVAHLGEGRESAFARFSAEKRQRLLRIGHTTSYESADKDKQQYAGAIKLLKKVFSFSGLAPEADECVAAYVALSHNYFSLDGIKKILSHNELLNVFLERVDSYAESSVAERASSYTVSMSNESISHTFSINSFPEYWSLLSHIRKKSF